MSSVMLFLVCRKPCYRTLGKNCATMEREARRIWTRLFVGIHRILQPFSYIDLFILCCFHIVHSSSIDIASSRGPLTTKLTHLLMLHHFAITFSRLLFPVCYCFLHFFCSLPISLAFSCILFVVFLTHLSNIYMDSIYCHFC